MLNPQELAQNIDNAIKNSNLDPKQNDYSYQIWLLVSTEIINHIKQKIEITIPQTQNQGIIVTGQATVTNQGINPQQLIGNGDGNIK